MRGAGVQVVVDEDFIGLVGKLAEKPASGVIDKMVFKKHMLTELTYTNNGKTVEYVNGVYTLADSSKPFVDAKPEGDKFSKAYILDSTTGKYVELAIQGTGVGAKSTDIASKFIYYPGGRYGDEGYYYISGRQYSGNITDIDAYLDRMAAWNKDNLIGSNFIKVNLDVPIQTYDPEAELAKNKNNKEINSTVVRGQIYYIDFQWDDDPVHTPAVMAIFTGGTADTWWRGDLTSNVSWPTNKGIWAVIE